MFILCVYVYIMCDYYMAYTEYRENTSWEDISSRIADNHKASPVHSPSPLRMQEQGEEGREGEGEGQSSIDVDLSQAPSEDPGLLQHPSHGPEVIPSPAGKTPSAAAALSRPAVGMLSMDASLKAAITAKKPALKHVDAAELSQHEGANRTFPSGSVCVLCMHWQ